ncbi:restriction endonuclease subunit S [Psychrobacter urativorans]|uniref:restriction endonuclease subunit S n=1 Tax=Psychrobacter urativorans TaxID=45610 RepID=UPI0019180BB7|nr:restriction endonuclease subunit S [Psychrobacter urativorans]
MASDWVEASLGDFVDHQKGFIFKSKDYQDEGELIVRVSDFTDRSIDITSCNKIDKSRAGEFQSVRLNVLDVVIATVGSWPKNPASIVGKTINVPKNADGALLNQNAVRLRAVNEMDQRFLFFLLKNKGFQSYIVSTAQGSANQASITLKDIFKYTFNLPPLQEQKTIAHILGSLDDKIELNRQMNETLEAMAQALFKSWFVDFDPVIDNALAAGNPIPDELLERAEQRQAMQHSDNDKQAIRALFPDAFEFTEEMDWIPKGWKIIKVLDLSEKLTKGTTPSKADLSKAEDEASIPFLKVMNIDNNGFIKAEKLENIPKSIHEGSLKRSIIKEGDVLFSIAGTIGRTSIVPKKLDNSNVNQAIAFIRLKDSKKSNFLLQLLKSKETQNIVHSKIVQAVQANFSLTELGGLILAEPSNNVFDSWFEKTESVFMKISDLQDNTSALTKLRDTLLPKLLSGELRIPDAAALVEDA